LENGQVGDVYDIGLRSIKIMDFENTIHIIPNKEIANKTVINYTYPDNMIRIKINVGVAYGSNVEKVKEVLIQQFKSHSIILDEPEPKAYFMNMGDSSLDFMAVGYVAAYKDQWQISEEIRIMIYNALVAAGISIPFPHRTLTVSDELIKKIKK
jgi:small-conductance mechanosensitive channel